MVELPGGHAFRVRTVHDVFRKLHRERQRFIAASEAGDRVSQIDAAINFAITAWHMTDWIWCLHEHAAREHSGAQSIRQFQGAMRHSCPDFAVCDVIANAAKHGGAAHERDDRPHIQTILAAEQRGGMYVAQDPEWSVKIEVDGQLKDPHAWMHAVFLHWHRFIQAHCVEH